MKIKTENHIFSGIKQRTFMVVRIDQLTDLHVFLLHQSLLHILIHFLPQTIPSKLKTNYGIISLRFNSYLC